MKSKVLGLLALSLLAAPMQVNAVMVTWDLRGSIASSPPAAIPPFEGVVVGDPFQLLLSFDTDAVLLQTNEGGSFEPGRRYDYDPSSLSMSLIIGGRAPVDYAVDPMALGSSFFHVRDNSGELPFEAGGLPIDGYTLGITFATGYLTVLMRGPVLDIVSGGGLPAVPDPRLADLPVSFFHLGATGASHNLIGDIASIRSASSGVPEPGTLALLGFGLLGLGMSRRRKA